MRAPWQPLGSAFPEVPSGPGVALRAVGVEADHPAGGVGMEPRGVLVAQGEARVLGQEVAVWGVASGQVSVCC